MSDPIRTRRSGVLPVSPTIHFSTFGVPRTEHHFVHTDSARDKASGGLEASDGLEAIRDWPSSAVS